MNFISTDAVFNAARCFTQSIVELETGNENLIIKNNFGKFDELRENMLMTEEKLILAQVQQFPEQ